MSKNKYTADGGGDVYVHSGIGVGKNKIEKIW